MLCMCVYSTRLDGALNEQSSPSTWLQRGEGAAVGAGAGAGAGAGESCVD